MTDVTEDPAVTAAATAPSEPSASAAAVSAYSELAQIVLSHQPLGEVLSRVALLTRRVIPDAAEVSVTLIERDRPRTVAFSGDLAVALDERQYQTWRGPCMDAALTGQVIAIDDMAHDILYPEFSRQSYRAGIRCILSIGLPTLVQGTTGALNIYGAGDPFDTKARNAAIAFASYAAVAVTNAAAFSGAVMEAEQLREAMTSRAVIEQAKGIVMSRYRCTADEAFSRLRVVSNQENKKLRDVAQFVVESLLKPPPESGKRRAAGP